MSTEDITVVQFKQVRAVLQQAAQDKNVQETWGKYFTTGLKIAFTLYLVAYAELDAETQDIHALQLQHLFKEGNTVELVWWIFASIQEPEISMCKPSTSQKHGIS